MNKELIDIIAKADCNVLLAIAKLMQKENEKKVNELLKQIEVMK